MIQRRLTYGAALLAAAALHLAYGQYATYYILLFLLFLPILSLLLSLPAVLTAKVELYGGADVQRGRPCEVYVRVSCRFFLPPELYKLKIEQKNLFLDARGSKEKVLIFGTEKKEEVFHPDTGRLGTISYRFRSARACDYLGLLAIPIKRTGTVALTVLPNSEQPEPMPELSLSSELVRKPKPLGYSEDHELRPYREGDAVNLIHWKLTEKMDTPIVREPQEMLRRRVVLSMDLYDNYEKERSVLEQLRCLADQLLKSEIPFILRYGLRTAEIKGEGDLERFLKSLLSEPKRDEPAQPYRGGSDTLMYRIEPRKEAANETP
ncbi:MAG: DUF58 domain-containing protein [Clostridia bacterium]|nr:DUF58 domain-containing protein [Clostridia bacterium]